jgi:excisionase family DNA binding protein
MTALQITLAPEQLDALADRIIAGLSAPNKKSLTLAEAATELNLSKSSVRRMLKAGTLARIPGISKPLIPASEIKRITS